MSPAEFVREARLKGVRSAWESFRKRRHLLPLAGYLLLAVMVAYTFGAERHHSNQNRDLLAREVHSTLLNGCVRGNELRGTLRQIIVNSAQLQKPQIEAGLKSGRITQAQADLAQRFTDSTLADLGPVDCNKAYPEPTEAE